MALSRKLDLVITPALGAPADQIWNWATVASRAALLQLGATTPVPPWAASSVNQGISASIPYPNGYHNPALKTLDLVVGDASPGSASDRHCVITFPDRSDPVFIPGGILGPDRPGLCHDYTITPGDIGYGQVVDVFVLCWQKLSADFYLGPVPIGNYFNSPPGINCSATGVQDVMKWFFPAGVLNPGISRFGTYLHQSFCIADWPSFSSPSGAVWNGPFLGDAGIPWSGSPYGKATLAELIRWEDGANTLRTLGWFEGRYRIRNTRTVSLPPASTWIETGTVQVGSSASQVILKNGGGLGVIPFAVTPQSALGHLDTKLILIYPPGWGGGKFPNGYFQQCTIASIAGAGGPQPTLHLRYPNSIPLLTATPPGPGAPDTTVSYILAHKPLVGDGIVMFQIPALMAVPIGLTDLVTATDSSQTGLYCTPTQVAYKSSLDRNMNMGPAFEGMQLHYGDVLHWTTSRPSWGDATWDGNGPFFTKGEPYVLLSDEDFSTMPATNPGVDPQGWTRFFPSANQTIGTDPTSPVSPDKFLRVTYPAGFPVGGGPVKLQWNGIGSHPNFRKFTHDIWLRVGAGFSNLATGDPSHPAVTGTKFGFTEYLPIVGGPNYSHYYINLYGGSNNPDQGFMGVNIEGPAGATGAPSTNYPVPNWSWKDHYDEWHRITVETIANSFGKADGIIRFYIDQVLMLEVVNAKFFADALGDPPGWGMAEITGTFGGAFPNQVGVQNTQHFDVAHYRTYGVPTVAPTMAENFGTYGGNIQTWLANNYDAVTKPSGLYVKNTLCNFLGFQDDSVGISASEQQLVPNANRLGTGPALRWIFSHNGGPSGLCTSYQIGRQFWIPGQGSVRKAWIRVIAKISPNFATKVINPAVCPSGNNAWKWILVAPAGAGPAPNRWDWEIGAYPSSNDGFGSLVMNTPGNVRQSDGAAGQTWQDINPINSSQYFDGQWHEWWVAVASSVDPNEQMMSTGPSPQLITVGSADGQATWAMDGTILRDLRNLRVAGWNYPNRMTLCANLNQGPDVDHVGMNVTFDRVEIWTSDPVVTIGGVRL